MQTEGALPLRDRFAVKWQRARPSLFPSLALFTTLFIVEQESYWVLLSANTLHHKYGRFPARYATKSGEVDSQPVDHAKECYTEWKTICTEALPEYHTCDWTT